MTHAHQFIQTPGELQNLAARLAGESCVVLDTEFVWERTFYPILGLVQIALPDGSCYLLDTVAAPDLSPLAGVLSDPRIEKILHDAPQDLMILNRAAGAPARRVFDTRLAAGFAGMDSQTSLQNLLADLAGVQLPKGHTRTDWTARPLSRDQLEYAVDDVIHMPRVALLLREKARASGVEGWLDEELAELFDKATYAERAPEESFLRIKASSFLQPRNLAALKELAAWRERTARAADLPRGFVVTDPELVSVAQVLPASEADFSKCRQLDPRIARRHGAHLLAAVKRGLDAPEAQWPKPVAPPDERQVGRERIQALLHAIRVKAEERHVDSRLVATKGEVVQVLAEGPDAKPGNHRLLRGWRAELLGNTVTSALGQAG
jgi:ribonuclease D